MAPKSRANCQICETTESKYVCPKCSTLYCSVKCFKVHKNSTCVDCVSGTNTRYKDDTLQPSVSEDSADSHRTTDLVGNRESHTNPNVETEAKKLDTAHRSVEDNPASSSTPEQEDYPLPKHKPLRPLTSVKWPYIPEESSYPDPLKRDDPKPLSLAQYEAIATSPSIRKALSSNPNLPEILRSIDRLRGTEREEELQRLLGVNVEEGRGQFSVAGLSTPVAADKHGARKVGKVDVDEEGARALRELAAAVENAVRGDRKDVLGLDWEDV